MDGTSVTIIDTIGFLDRNFSEKHLLRILKSRIPKNVSDIFVCVRSSKFDEDTCNVLGDYLKQFKPMKSITFVLTFSDQETESSKSHSMSLIKKMIKTIKL